MPVNQLDAEEVTINAFCSKAAETFKAQFKAIVRE